MPRLSSQRDLFDIPEDVAYFNCAYNAPLLNASRDRLIAGVRTKSHPWERTAQSFFEEADVIRRLCADIFGGDSDGYAVVPAASYGISTAARAIEPTLRSGDRIIVIAEEFPSNVLPWRRVAKETGAVVETVSPNDDGDLSSAILARIRPEVKVVSISPCHWTNGLRVDLASIGAACRQIGCALVVDATQTLGAMPFSVEEVRPDFLAASGYKWLLCPYGFSVLYVSPRWREARPLEESWLARNNAADFSALVHYSDTYMPGARRFDVGEKCTATLLPGAVAALEQIKAWGVANIASSLASINAKIGAVLLEAGCKVTEERLRCPHMFGALLPGMYRGNVVSELQARKIHVSQRGNALRFAPHLHVSDHDVARLLEALAGLIR